MTWPFETPTFGALYRRKIEWSRRMFPRQNPRGIVAHLERELGEVARDPFDVTERADLALLLMDLHDRGWASKDFSTIPPFVAAWDGCRRNGSMRLRPVLASDFIEVPHGRNDIPGITHPLDLGYAIWRSFCGMDRGLSSDTIWLAVAEKLDENMSRKWPAPSEQTPGLPVEHVR